MVDVAALQKRPKRRVQEDLEKISMKKQEKEYQKFLNEQIKQYKEQKQKINLK